jgi:hypothetical protein
MITVDLRVGLVNQRSTNLHERTRKRLLVILRDISWIVFGFPTSPRDSR